MPRACWNTSFAIIAANMRPSWQAREKNRAHSLFMSVAALFFPIGWNFFTDNYREPIVECGVRLVDMIYLRRSL